jgi:hypothetical protein
VSGAGSANSPNGNDRTLEVPQLLDAHDGCPGSLDGENGIAYQCSVNGAGASVEAGCTSVSGASGLSGSISLVGSVQAGVEAETNSLTNFVLLVDF